MCWEWKEGQKRLSALSTCSSFITFHSSSLDMELKYFERCEHLHYYLDVCLLLLMPKTSLIVTWGIIIWRLYGSLHFWVFFSFFVLNNDVFIVLWCGLRLTESINKAFKYFIHWMGFLLLMQRRMWEKMKLGLAVGIGENGKLLFTGSGDGNAHNVMFTH